MTLLFDEKEFISSIIADKGSEFEDILEERYDAIIGYGSEKEKEIYSNYEKTFILDIGFDRQNMIIIPCIRDTYFINFIPDLIDILRCKINNELEICNISDAETEIGSEFEFESEND